jgi:hypothetical protein
VANELINNGNTIEIKGIYEQSKTDDTGMINLLNLNDDELDDLINKTADITSKPILYQLSTNTEISTYENTLPIHRKIYDKANMEMYELDLQIKKLNPDCEFVGIKTDCAVYNNITTEPAISNVWGGIKKCDVPLIKECTIIGQREPRTDTYVLSNITYNKITWSPEDGYKNDKGIMIDKNKKS